MAQTTAYIVQPFEWKGKSRLRMAPAFQAASPAQAERVAERFAQRGGAIAFSQTGDPETGDYGEPRIIGVFGEVPEAVLEQLG